MSSIFVGLTTVSPLDHKLLAQWHICWISLSL